MNVGELLEIEPWVTDIVEVLVAVDVDVPPGELLSLGNLDQDLMRGDMWY